MHVSLIHHPRTATTTVSDAAGTRTVAEPDGIRGVHAAAALYSAAGYTVVLRVAR
jgi:hypothetical protein